MSAPWSFGFRAASAEAQGEPCHAARSARPCVPIRMPFSRATVRGEEPADRRWLGAPPPMGAPSRRSTPLRAPRPRDSGAARAAADVDAAVAAARAAFDSWRTTTPARRARILWAIADLIEANIDELAELETLDQGKPLFVGRWAEIPGAAGQFRFFAGQAHGDHRRHDAKLDRLSARGQADRGVDGARAGRRGSRDRAVEFAAGADRDEAGPGAGGRVYRGAQAGRGYVAQRVAPRRTDARGRAAGGRAQHRHRRMAHETGAALAAHPHVDKVAFTGSTATGRAILDSAKGNLKRVSLELGGKSPAIVLPDADLDLAIPGVANAIFFNAGQVCIAGSRLYVHRSIHDRVIEGVVAYAEGSRRSGHGLDAGDADGAARLGQTGRARRRASSPMRKRQAQPSLAASAAAMPSSTPAIVTGVTPGMTDRARGGVRPGAGRRNPMTIWRT